MRAELASVLWARADMAQALEALAKCSKLPALSQAVPPMPESLHALKAADICPWMEQAAQTLGLECERALCNYGEREFLLKRAAPALLLVELEGQSGLLLLVGHKRGRVRLLGPNSRVSIVGIEFVLQVVSQDLEKGRRAQTEALVEAMNLAPARFRRAVDAILLEQLREAPLDFCFMLRVPPSHGFWSQLNHARVPHRVGLLVLCHGLQFALSLMTWWVIGEGALGGHLDIGWLMAWVLLLLSQVPLRLLALWLMGQVSIEAGGLLKSRLMHGALSLEPSEIRRKGSGQLLATVLESEALEGLAINGGVAALLSVLELAFGAAVLAAGAGGLWQLGALGLWLLLTSAFLFLYGKKRRQWTDGRLAMTHDLVERMLGHRTRLVQCRPERWHRGEDELLASYHASTRELDRLSVLCTAWVPRGWLIVGVVALAPAFVFASPNVLSMAVAIGALVLIHRSLRQFGAGMVKVIGAVVAWRQMSLMFEAAGRHEGRHSWAAAWAASPKLEAGERLLDVRDVSLTYEGRLEPVLHKVNLTIHSGDRLLLQGPSGGGKSTLGALLTGLKQPTSGLILLKGFDHHSLGSTQWRRHAVSAPQFHENHIISGTFAFNLLMGRAWPPTEGDLLEAQTLCEELGLGPLLKRMPSGLLQMVGEIGWQLSHGEQSRLFLARALLQNSDFIVLDESFAALDPKTLSDCLKTVLKKSQTIMVIAHP